MASPSRRSRWLPVVIWSIAALPLAALVVAGSIGYYALEHLADSPSDPRVELGQGVLHGWSYTAQSSSASGSGQLLSPYDVGLHGYDLSFWACGRGQPSGADFAVVGLNGGRAFSLNPCFPDEWAHAPQPRAIYLNTGFNPDNVDKVTADCALRARSLRGDDDQHLAYAVGCSEADYSLLAVHDALASRPPQMVWLDVETANSWSTLDPTLNVTALSGMVDRLLALRVPMGVYSTGPMWIGVTGGTTHPAIAADWVAGERWPDGCVDRGFTNAPVWLVQDRTPWPGPGAGFDSDRSC